ncbi:hypothetical protein [Nocardioides yefusunii]|uniref:WD40 repeat domain-containing protein n=1 Tax=Nocardioides yefusunii TaxID=2500546 RepID=A0ABW1QYZ8_9ACTN|nr:hypothetical protein [Nocardioides yefusunii]
MSTPTPFDDETLTADLTRTFDALTADFTPAPLDAADLWQRGRHERRRDLLQVVAAAVVLVLLLTATALAAPVQVLPASTPDPSDPDAGAFPTRVHVPEIDDDVPIESEFPTGRASIALMIGSDRGTALVLLVDAVDGTHTVVSVPGLPLRNDTSTGSVWLSPDGWHLAYPTLTRTGVGTREAGLSVVDLRTGGTVSAPTGPAAATGWQVTDLAWSPDSTHFVWTASAFDTANPTEDTAVRLGRGTAESPVGTSVPVPDEAVGWFPALALSSDDVVVLANEDVRSTWRLVGDEIVVGATRRAVVSESDQESSEPDVPEMAGAGFSRDGASVIAGLGSHGDTASKKTTVAHDTRSLLNDSSDDPVSGVTQAWSIDADTDTGVALLGVTPAGALLLQPSFAAGSVYRGADDGDASGGSAIDAPVLLEFTSLYGASPEEFSLAVDLGDRAPVKFAAPEWERSHTWVLWALASGAAAVALVWAVFRSRTSRPSSEKNAEVPVTAVRVAPTTMFTLGFLGTCALLVTMALSVVPPVLGVPMAIGLALLAFAWGRKVWLPAASSPRRRTARTVVALAVVGCVTAWAAAPLAPVEGVEFAPGALPVTVEAPQGRVDEVFPGTRGTTPLDEVGRLSALTSTSRDMLMGVSATNGRHMVLDVDTQQFGMRTESPALALSPDGLLVVAPWEDLGTTTAESSAGLRLIDVTGGPERHLALTGEHGRPVTVEQVTFSADGSHLAWVGDEMNQFDEGGSSWSGEARTVGVTRVDDLTAGGWRIAKASENTAIAVSDDGVGRFVTGRRLATFTATTAPEVRRFVPTTPVWEGAAVSPDGTRLVLGVGNNDSLDLIEEGLWKVDLTTADATATPLDWAPTGALGVRPLGWSRLDELVVQTTSHQRLGSYLSPSFVEVQALRIDAGEIGDARLLSTAELPHQRPLWVATDLAHLDPVDFGEQRWPVTDERLWGIGIGAAGTLALLVLLGRDLGGAVRRRRRTGS